jgi:sec-independent protein translocase protein TatA
MDLNPVSFPERSVEISSYIIDPEYQFVRTIAHGLLICDNKSITDITEQVGMFGLGLPEVGVILVIAVLIFGPKKVPELGKALGQTLRGFKEEMGKTTSEEDSEIKE